MADKVPTLEDLFITHTHDDLVGKVSVNVADGLFAIAHAINRLAAVQELSMQRTEELDAECRAAYEAAVADRDSDAPGHS